MRMRADETQVLHQGYPAPVKRLNIEAEKYEKERTRRLFFYYYFIRDNELKNTKKNNTID
jgi:hypothetical protein